jgi:hypothetical protein
MKNVLISFCEILQGFKIKQTSVLLLLMLSLTGIINAQDSDAVAGAATDFSGIIGYHVGRSNSTAKSNSKYSSVLTGSSNKIILKTPSGEFTGTINLARTVGTSDQIVGAGEKAGTQFELKSEADGTINGLYTSTSDNIAYKYYTNSEDGTVHVKEIDINSVMCVNYNKTTNVLELEEAKYQTTRRRIDPPPIRESLPGSKFVIYLDFDGEVFQGKWNNGDTVFAQPIDMTASEMEIAWSYAAEDFAPFNVNITTSRAVYDATSISNKLMVIITATKLYPGAAGVAHMNSFGNGDVCWVFSKDPFSCGLAVSHEVGHTLGLHHDGIDSSAYYGGHDVWGPIMGVPYHHEVRHWSKGEYNGATNTQDDLDVLATNYGFGYNPDRVGDNILSAARLTVQTDGTVRISDNKGLIEKPADKDVYSFSTLTGGSVNLNFNPHNIYPSLNIQARLLDSNGNEITKSDPTNSMGATLIATVGKGTFYVEIDGVGHGANPSVGYSDYSSLGPYTIEGSVPLPNTGPITDCNNEIGGTAFIDNCGTCAGGTTGIVPNSTCLIYCDATGGAGTGSDFIKSVSYGSVVNNTEKEYYADFTQLKASFLACQKVGVTVKLNYAFPGDFCYAWVDWNKNGVFDTHERTDFPVYSNNSTYTEVAVPANAVGDFTMRIRNTYHHSLPGVPTPCGTNAGEVEDYTINISNTCNKDCNGDAGGSATVDNCNVCSGGNTGLVANTSCTDCNNVVNGTASIDNCNVCSGGNTGIIANSSCNIDCNGEDNGTAFIDGCNICVEGNTGKSKIVNGIPTGYVFLGNEGDTKTLPTKSNVVYGHDCSFTYLYGLSGSIAINNGTFGDPAPGQVKKAYYKTLGVVTSTDEQTTVSGLNIYPNPVRDQVTIDGEFNDWTLTDSKGAFVQEGTEKVVDVGGLSPGLYYINVDGVIRKIIKI